MDPRSKALEYAVSHQAEFLEQLKDLIRIPSISTAPENNGDVQKTAEWLAHKLTRIGMKNVQILPTGGHPVVYGECICARENAPTVLVYGHYDVQPVDPLELWTTEPFNPSQRGENLYARGASDMKGQVMASIDAVEAVMMAGEPPVNIKFILEGEEEIGSPNLVPFIKAYRELLSCDVALNPDCGMIGADAPTITYALRGLAYFELRVYGPEHDLHSGLYGGAVHNPAIVLAEWIAGMHDADGRITLPGFYDRVRSLDAEERAQLARLPLSEAHFLAMTGVSALFGEKGYTPVEQVGARPTLDVNGLYSGFIGAGSKTVLPAYAMAKISMRLVPDQDPAEVQDQLIAYLNARTPKTVRWELTNHSSSKASISDIHHPAVKSLVDGLAAAWGTAPLYKREGGSVPIVGDMQRILGVESVLTGFGLSDDNIHAPNEKLHLPTWYKGIQSLIHFFYNYGQA
ncbi:MAG: dipeptidase [Bellilinea sp.]